MKKMLFLSLSLTLFVNATEKHNGQIGNKDEVFQRVELQEVAVEALLSLGVYKTNDSVSLEEQFPLQYNEKDETKVPDAAFNELEEDKEESCSDLQMQAEELIDNGNAVTGFPFVNDQLHKSSTKSKKNQCTMCHYQTDRIAGLKRHMLIHNDERPYSCKECQKRFRHSYHLSEHMLIHNDERPYSCEKCQKRFRHSYHLSEHMRIHNDERPYSCEKCQKKFRQSGRLAEHMRIHNDERPYLCKECQKRFRREHHLAEHMRKHTGEKPYPCDICKERFARRFTLTVHMRITHKLEMNSKYFPQAVEEVSKEESGDEEKDEDN